MRNQLIPQHQSFSQFIIRSKVNFQWFCSNKTISYIGRVNILSYNTITIEICQLKSNTQSYNTITIEICHVKSKHTKLQHHHYRDLSCKEETH